MKPISRGAIFWGAALITAGLVVIAIQQGYVSDDILEQASRWWPLILIGAGVAIIFAGVLGVVATALAGVLFGLLVGGLIGGVANFPAACGTVDPGPVSAFEDGSFSAGGADVEIDLACLRLEVSGGTGRDWSVEADENSADHLDLSATSSSMDVRNDDVSAIGTTSRRHVVIVVPGEEQTNLTGRVDAGGATFDLSGGDWGEIKVEGNAGAIEIDLSDAQAGGLESSVNAGSVSIQLSEDSQVGAIMLAANAGAAQVCAPDALGLEITIGSMVAASHNLAEEGLDQDGDVWRTSGYESADNRVEITFSGNAAAFTLNPEGGCS